MQSTGTSPDSRLNYVFDLDGVIYRGSELQPHARQVVQTLRDAGHFVRFYTNNAANSRDDYVAKLDSLGIPTPIEEIMTSSYAAALYFIENHAVGKTVYRVGEAGMAKELEDAGMKVIYDGQEPDARIDFVVVGLDRDFHYRKLARAQRAIAGGATFIATNEDATFPVEDGGLLPGGGCMVAAIRTATGVDPILVGKPRTYALDKILGLTNTPPERAIVVGDRLDTDIEVGNRAGAQTVLVLTGVTSRAQAESATGYLKPHRIIETLAELIV